MPRKLQDALVSALAVGFGLLIAVTPVLAADRVKDLHYFDINDGQFPEAGLIFDAGGNLYGTTTNGGKLDNCDNGDTMGCGVVFQLVSQAHGKWTEKVLYRFKGERDGIEPVAGVIFDTDGNLYGTTPGGGVYQSGTAFELTPTANGEWAHRILYSFGGSDGSIPMAGLVFDSAGNLYGTAGYGGSHGAGSVYRLAPGANGHWVLSTLHSFNSDDGAHPVSALVFDAVGNLYGTTMYGGTYGQGTVFQLTPGADDKWMEKVLHSFKGGRDPGMPAAGMAIDKTGNLYGTTTSNGAAFELSPRANGSWSYTVLHEFDSLESGYPPSGVLILDAAGNLYGTTEYGGTSCGQVGCGTVFELRPKPGGGWREVVLVSLGGDAYPQSGVIFDASGNLYGTSRQGSNGKNCIGYGCGSVWEVRP